MAKKKDKEPVTKLTPEQQDKLYDAVSLFCDAIIEQLVQSWDELNKKE